MRAIGTTIWLSAVLFPMQACGPRVSVGDLGAAGSGGSKAGAGSAAQSGSSQGRTNAGEGGKQATGGVPTAGGLATAAGGEVAAEGGAAAGDGGAPNTECQSTLETFLPPVAIACPAEIPDSGAPCDDAAENGICIWQTGTPTQSSLSGYAIRGCYSAVGGNQWYGTDQNGLGPPGADPQNCPSSMPAPGSSCAGHSNENCYYPEAGCGCSDNPPTWNCRENPKPALVPAPVARLCPPAGVDESRVIRELTFPEIDAWCRWYGGAPGERPQMTGNDSPGYADTYSTAFGHIGADVCLMDLPLDWCAKNFLARQANCTATLEQLDDCVESIRGWSHAKPAWVGRGCGPLLSIPGCRRLIVQEMAPNHAPGDCKVPVGQGVE